MRKIKSRNFILMVCGVCIILILGLAITKTLVAVISDVGDGDNEKQLLSNIISSSSKIKLTGSGNFVDVTPKVSGTTISNFNVKLVNFGDKVNYSIRFCNMNNSSLVFKRLVTGDIICSDAMGVTKECNDVSMKGYVVVGDRKIDNYEEIKPNCCIEMIIEAEYIGKTSDITFVTGEKYYLEFGNNN